MNPERVPLEETTVDAASKAMAALRALHCREAEVFVCLTNAISLTIEPNDVLEGATQRESQVFFRAVDGARMGVAFTNSLEQADLKRCAAAAMRLAKVNEVDPRWRGFAEAKTKYPEVGGIHDDGVASMTMEDLRLGAKVMIDAALEQAVGITVTSGQLRSVTRSIAVHNTAGIEKSFSDAHLSAMCGTVSGHGSSVSPDCYDGCASRLNDIDFSRLGASCGSVARNCAVSVEPRTEECPVVFANGSLGAPGNGLLNAILTKACSGESAIQRTTFLANRVGDRIGPKSLTIVDDPLSGCMVGSRPFDDEGMPVTRTSLVKGGVFEGFLWNSYHGSVAGRKSTGNAVRDLSTGYVTSAPLNMCMKAGRGSLEDLVSEVDHGYLAWGCQGAHTSNAETGDFSFVPSPSFLIDRGSIVGCSRGAMLSGNLLELFSGIEKVGGDQVDFGTWATPSALVRSVKVTAA